MKEDSARRARGLAMYKKLGWGTNEGLKSVDEEVWGLTTDFILLQYGDGGTIGGRL